MSDQPTLETRRLILRPFTLEDAPRVRELAGAREIADTTLVIPHPYPEGAAEAWISTHAPAWEQGSAVSYAITARVDGSLTGAIGLSIDRTNSAAEMGYWIAVPFWNRGYCTEAGRALLALAFGALGLHRVYARYFARNEASGRVMQKLGMRLEGTHRDAIRKKDRYESLVEYAILATDRENIANSAGSGLD